MAIMHRRPTTPRIPAPLLGALILAALAGCAVLAHRSDTTPGFRHVLHTRDVGLSCEHCHEGAASGERAGLPQLTTCRTCHSEAMEAALPEELRLAAILGDAPLEWASHTSVYPEDVTFSHAAHAGAGLACEGCHGTLASLDAGGARSRIEKPECLSCHAESSVDPSCATCHREIDENWLPPNHDAGWMTLHGRVVRHGDPQEFTETCSFCHQESTCVDCHLSEPPRSHTHFWKQRGHGIEARIDRSTCATCHTPDSCDRCHQETAPISHRGPWGDPLNVHCTSCHLEGSRECALCHDGTPSHLLATPLPPGHLPSFNCRQCHGLSAPLPHVDSGDECTACHF